MSKLKKSIHNFKKGRHWPKQPDGCQLNLAQLRSNFGPSYLQLSLFHTPVSDLKCKRPNNQKYATGINPKFTHYSSSKHCNLFLCLQIFPILVPTIRQDIGAWLTRVLCWSVESAWYSGLSHSSQSGIKTVKQPGRCTADVLIHHSFFNIKKAKI